MRTTVAAILVAGALAGCGSAARSERVYAKPGASEAQRERDARACRLAAVGSADVTPMPTWSHTFNREAFNECLRARGDDVRLGRLRPSVRAGERASGQDRRGVAPVSMASDTALQNVTAWAAQVSGDDHASAASPVAVAGRPS